MNDIAIARMRSGKPCTGTWLSTGSPVIAELAGQMGFDWLLLDFEHGCAPEAALPSLLQALNGTSSAIIVRVGAPHPDIISRALDWGADGIMVPHVSNAEEASQCLQAIHYPPRGQRGFSRSVRTYRYGLQAPKPGQPLPSPLFLAQIETADAVAQAHAIARVDGVDGLFIGPADLGLDLQVRGRNNKADFESCLTTVLEASRAAGIAAGILARDEADIPRFQAAGFAHLAIDSDLAILRRGFQHLLSKATSPL